MAVTTHAEFVRAVAKAVRKAGGEPYIGERPNGRGNLLKVHKVFLLP